MFQTAVENIRGTAPGDRYDTTFAASASCGNYIEGGELFDEDAVHRGLLKEALRTGMKRRDAERAVRDGLARGMTTPKTAPKTLNLKTRADAIARTFDWWDGVEAHQWRGRTAATDLRILAAFATTAIALGRVRFTYSHRQIAEDAGVCVATLWRSRDRWGRFVRVVKKGNPRTGLATTWQLVVRPSGSTNPERREETENSPEGNSNGITPFVFTSFPPPSGTFPRSSGLNNPAHDYWSGWGTGWRVFRLLDRDEPTTAREVETVVGVHVKTARRALNRLRDWGVAARGDDGGWRLTGNDVESPGFRRRARHQRHEKEREAYRRAQAERLRRERSEGEATVDYDPADDGPAALVARRTAPGEQEDHGDGGGLDVALELVLSAFPGSEIVLDGGTLRPFFHPQPNQAISRWSL